MNLEIILTPLLISLFVSVLFWALVYLIPLLFPRQLASFVFYFKRELPHDPIEIGLLMHQFLQNNNWNRILAKNILEKLFNKKITQLESKKYSEWQNELKIQKELMEHRTLTEDEILHLEAGHELKKRYNNSIPSPVPVSEPNSSNYYLNQYEEEFIAIRNNKVADLSQFKDKYGNIKIWSLKNRNLLKLIQDRVFNNQSINMDKISTSSPEWALINLWGMSPPEKFSNNHLFDEIILYLDFHLNDKEREKFIKKLSIGLSSHKKSLPYLEEIITAIDHSN